MSSSFSEVELCLQRIREVIEVDADFGLDCRTPVELCRLLEDGERLCCILSALSDGLVSPDGDGTISLIYSENSQIFARRNVRFFLSKCSELFGLGAAELFEPADLLEGRRPERVVAGLLTLLTKFGPAASNGAAGSGEAKFVIGEICQSERHLVEKLEMLLRFRNELRGLLSEWSEDLVEGTFRYSEDLLKLHADFSGRLTRMAETETPAGFCAGLAGQFREMVPELSVYAKYYAHFPLARATLESELGSKPQLMRQLRRLETHFEVPSFNALYDSPFRQMFNYTTLFERLWKTAKREVPESAKFVEEALIECRRLLNQFNECKRVSEKAAATLELLQSLAGLPDKLAQLASVGLHRADGTFRVRMDQGPEKNRFCLLTDRQVIVAKPARSRESSSIMHFQFTLPITEDLVLDSVATGGSGGSGRVFVMQHPSVGTAVFSNATGTKIKSLDVCLWGQLVTKAKAFNFPKGWNRNRHRYQLQTFPGDSLCSQCSQPMSGIVLQGYHCSHCGDRLDPRCLAQTLGQADRPESYPLGSSGRDTVDCQFYHRSLDRKAAEQLLANRAPGTFLIRRASDKDTLVLSMKWEADRIFHMFIQRRENDSIGAGHQFSIDEGIKWQPSLDRLIAFYRVNMLNVRGVQGVTLDQGVVPSAS